MAIIRLHKDPLKKKPEVYHAFGVKLIDWMFDNCRWAHNGCVVKVNGHIVANSLEHDDMAERLRVSVSGDDGVDIYAPPEEAATIIYAVVAIIAAGVAYALTPTPSIAGEAGKRNTSPNAQLNAANNEFRQDQAIPDKAGETIAYPDFLQPSYYEYVNNKRVFKEIFIVGRDYVGIDEVRSGSTLVSNITGSSYAVYQPPNKPSVLLNVRAVREIENILLIPGNDSSVFFKGDVGYLDGSQTFTFPSGVVASLEVSVGDTVNLLYFGETSGGQSVTIDGDYEIDAIDEGADSISFTGITTGDNSSGNLELRALSEEEEFTSWYNLEGDDIEEIRVHLAYPRGIRSESGLNLTISTRIQYQEVDALGSPVGSIMDVVHTDTENTSVDQYRTVKIDTSSNKSSYRIRVRRDTAGEPDPALDELRLEKVESVRSYSSSNFDNATFLEVERVSGALEGNASSKINARSRNEIPIFDPNTGTFGARAFTRSFAQYAMYLLVTLGGESLENIDYEALFDIEASLPSAELGYFDFSFDDAEVSLKDRLQSCLNVARCNYYMVGNRYNFVRDEPQDVRIALFNRRNIAPESSAQSFRFLRSDDYDSVELTYVDPVDNVKAYLTRRINRTTGAIEIGRGQRVKKMDLGGCRNEAQATDRINREILRIKYEWYRLKTTVLSEGQSVGVGNRIGWCDILEENLFQGEILGQSGDIFDTSEKFIPEDGVTYYVYIEQDDGTISNSVVATARTDTEFGFVASGLTAFVADGYTAQRGSGYVIAPLLSLNARDFIITSRSKADAEGKVTLEGYTYDERAYPENSTELPTG